MSYSYKEKQKHFNDLRECQEHVLADIELLEKKSPAHPQLTSYKRAPERKLNEVLYELLDFATREEIVANRRSYKSPEQLAAEEGAEKKAAEEAARLAEEAEKHESLQEEHETLKEEHEALQEENEDLQAANEELQEQTEALQEELAEEKKKEPVKAGAKASGKKKSTPK